MIPIALVGCCFVVTACGGGTKRLSSQQYAQRANAICARFNQQVRSFGTAANLKQLAALANKTAPALKTAARALRGLKPPKDEARTADAWIAKIDQLRTDVEQIRDRAEANDLAGVRRLVPSATRDDDATNRLARSLGATACVQSG